MVRSPRITLPDETEWLETVKGGWHRLAGSDPRRIIEGVHEVLKSRQIRLTRGGEGIYGNGKAGDKIVTIILSRITGILVESGSASFPFLIACQKLLNANN